MSLVSVGIPTYNGAASIRTVIDSLVDASNETKDIINVIVSNNASTDNTDDIIKEYEERINSGEIKYINLKYNVNPENIGFDGNVCKIIELSDTEFVWVLSDNECLVDSKGIQKIERLAGLYHPDIMCLDFNTTCFIKGEDEYYTDADLFFHDMCFETTLISSNVINKNTWMSLDMHRYIGCLWIHMAYLIEALAPQRGKSSACILRDQIFASVPTSSKWGGEGSFIDVGLKLVKVFNSMPALGYSQHSTETAKNCIKSGYPGTLVIARLQGYRFTEEKIKEMEELYNTFPSFYKKDVPAMKSPLIVSLLVAFPQIFTFYWMLLRRKIVEHFMKKKGMAK